MIIINSDIFVLLESKMLRERALELGRKFDTTKLKGPDDTIEEIE